MTTESEAPPTTRTVKLSTGGTFTFDPQAPGSRVLTLTQLRTLATERFGPEPMAWCFTCPVCGHTAAVGDFPHGQEDAAGFECLGRRVKDVGCDFAAFGLLPLAPWVIVPEEGEEDPVFLCFALAELEESAEPLPAAQTGDTNG